MSAGVIAGRFEMLAQAGAGGMSTVFRARDLQTSRVVAVKILKLDRPFDLKRFAREAQLLAQVRHENVVDYVAHGESDGVHYLAQEWVDGVTLATQTSTIGTTAREAVTIASGVARALAATHALGVIHRDIKPPNVILVGGSPHRVKVVDFGIARLANDAGVLTRTGVLVGTPAYMSPEQARGAIHIEPAADVWSLGCLLFELLTGRAAFAGKTHAAIRAKVLLGEHASIEASCPEAPRELVALVDDMLHKDASLRPADGSAATERLAALPEVADGPRRRFGHSEHATLSARVGGRGSKPGRAFVMFRAIAHADGAAPPPERDAQLANIAKLHHMDVHLFDDGSAVLASHSEGKQAALAAAFAAIEVHREVPSGAVSVFGVGGAGDSVNAAIDRGAVLAEHAAMSALFGEVVDDSGARVYADDTIVELVGGDLAIERAPEGAVVRAARRK
jgi:hypothetical protein